jgi:hypothetical protein
MTVASFVISCAAVLVALGALWYARGQKLAAEQSALEAKRSADAAAELAKIEQERRADEVDQANRLRVRFNLVHHNKSAYLLRNDGTDSAYRVHVDSQDIIARGDFDFAEFTAGETHKFILARTMGSADHITVTWHDEPDHSDSPRSVKLYV